MSADRCPMTDVTRSVSPDPPTIRPSEPRRMVQAILPDGRIYEVVASPYRDTDGVICQLATYREASDLVSSLLENSASD